MMDIKFTGHKKNDEKFIAVCRAILAYPDESNREIANRVGVSHVYVGKIRNAFREATKDTVK